MSETKEWSTEKTLVVGVGLFLVLAVSVLGVATLIQNNNSYPFLPQYYYVNVETQGLPANAVWYVVYSTNLTELKDGKGSVLQFNTPNGNQLNAVNSPTSGGFSDGTYYFFAYTLISNGSTMFNDTTGYGSFTISGHAITLELNFTIQGRD